MSSMKIVRKSVVSRYKRYFGTNPTIWLRLHIRYDLEITEAETGECIRRQVKVLQSPSSSPP